MNSNRAWWRWFSTGLGVNTAIVLFNAILIGILWHAVFGLVQTERQDTIRAAINRNDNLAIAFEQYTIRTIENADAVVQHLIEEYVHSGGKIDLTKWAADHAIDNKTIIGVVLADEHGNALTTAYSPNQAKQMNVADREHFRVHIERDSGRLFVGKPVVGRVTGQGVIPVTRRINKADGTFGGVAMALIEPARFTDVLQDARLRPLDIISLVGLDGITRARLRGTTASWGEDISNSPLLAERARHPNGNYFAIGQLDNVPRFYSYRTLPDYQVMTIVGAAEADVLAEFYRRQTRYFWVAGVTSAVIAGFAILLMLALASQRRAAAAVVRSQARIMATFAQAAVGIAHTDLEGRYLEVNQKLCEILGYSREELLKRRFNDVTHPDDTQSITDSRRQLLAKPGEVTSLEREKRYIRKDGAVIWCSVTLSVVHDDTGQVEYVLAMIQDISDRKRAEIRIQHLNRVYAVLSGINALIVRAHDRREVFNEACRIAVAEGQFPYAWIGVLDPSTQDVTPVAWAGESTEELTRTQSSARADSPRGQGAVGRAIRERRPVINNDISAMRVAGPRRDEILKLGFKSTVALPLFEDQTVVGTLTIYAREPHFCDEEELRLLTELAGNISFALANISRQQKLDKLARIRAFSSEINAAIVRIRDRKALLEETCRIASEQGKFEMIWIGMVDVVKQEIRAAVWAGFSPEIANRVSWKSITAAHGTLSEAILTRKPAVRNDIESDLPAGGMRGEALARGCGSTACLPLVVNDNVVALIAIFAPGVGFFDEDELALLNELAANVSFALQAIEKQERLHYLAYHDALTGLANRALFQERLEQNVVNANEQGRKLALVLLDIERFKIINDTLGRQAGDALLKDLAARMSGFAVDAGRLARIDADHFAIMVLTIQTEEELARLIEQRVEEVFGPPFRIGNSELRISARFGIAMFPGDGADADTLFINAETALKNAKARGDRYLFYTQTMNERVAEKLTLENQLRQALDNGEFVLHYQPKVNLMSGKLTSAEALIRWNDPRTGLVPPGRFIPILEETGLIFEVGRWALRQAIADYLRWRAAGLAAVRIAVNVSPLQLRNRSFVDEIKRKISIDTHAPAGLELEITESLIMADVKHSIASLQAIRALGVTIAIDDFGTGFSSLSYLAKLPVNTLKIDNSFVLGMTAGPEGLALVSIFINLAHSLKLKVVAEGVETEEQSRLLRLLSCDEMQGNLFSKPVPCEVFETRFLAAPAAG